MGGDIATESLLTVAGATVVVSIVVGVILRALNLSPESKDRFGPLIAIIVGVVIVGAVALYTGADIAQALITGLLAGSASMGLYDTVKAVMPRGGG